jgi:hypothetical protein
VRLNFKTETDTLNKREPRRVHLSTTSLVNVYGLFDYKLIEWFIHVFLYEIVHFVTNSIERNKLFAGESIARSLISLNHLLSGTFARKRRSCSAHPGESLSWIWIKVYLSKVMI